MAETLEDLQHREIETLRERVRQLEEALMPPTLLPVEWRLTGSEARVFSCLAGRDMATKQVVMLALYSDRIDDDVEPKIVDVFICKMRKKLKPFGVEILTVWGTGYALKDRERWAIQPKAAAA